MLGAERNRLPGHMTLLAFEIFGVYAEVNGRTRGSLYFRGVYLVVV